MEEEFKDNYEGYHKENYFQQVVQDAIDDLRETGSGYCFSLAQMEEVKTEIPNVKYRLIDSIYYLNIEDTDDESNEYFAVKVEKKWMKCKLAPSEFMFDLFTDYGVKFKSFKNMKYLNKFLVCKKTRNEKEIEESIYVVFNRRKEVCSYKVKSNVLQMVFEEYGIKYVEYNDENDEGYIHIMSTSTNWKGGDTNGIKGENI